MTNERIKLLEKKIQEAVEYIITLREENRNLQTSVHQKGEELKDLKEKISQIREEHGSIEQGVENALKSLEVLEDEIAQAKTKTQSGNNIHREKDINTLHDINKEVPSSDNQDKHTTLSDETDKNEIFPSAISSSPTVESQNSNQHTEEDQHIASHENPFELEEDKPLIPDQEDHPQQTKDFFSLDNDKEETLFPSPSSDEELDDQQLF